MQRDLFTRAFALLMALSLPMVAVGADSDESLRDQIESSMRLTGSIDIEADGSVSAFTLDQEDKVSAALADYVHQKVASWHFEPVLGDGGEAVQIRTPVHLRLLAKSVAGEDDSVELSIASADFSKESAPKDPTTLHFDRMQPPQYPLDAVRARVSGDVAMLVEVGRDGRVKNLHARQVNLRVQKGARIMKKWRARLAAASEHAIRDWTFKVPTEGPQADCESWHIVVPISFSFDRSAAKRYGQWDTYVAGPVQSTPWLDKDDAKQNVSADALADGGLYLLREDGPRLLSSLDKGP
ncbi:MAG TPA: energy transducer TonB [Chiayiivirga sp.]|nr:energy transducer TonB [Chiayiivirga sp.]